VPPAPTVTVVDPEKLNPENERYPPAPPPGPPPLPLSPLPPPAITRSSRSLREYSGVTELDADEAVEVPFVFVAVIVNVYA
jgi:hypothetical protein